VSDITLTSAIQN